MMKKISFTLFVAVVFCSCVSNRKLSSAKAKLDNLKGQHQAELAQMQAINNTAADMLNQGKIDDNIQGIIAKRITSLQAVTDSVQKQIDLLDSLMKDKKTSRQKYKKIILPALDSLQNAGNAYAGRLAVYMMVQEGLNIADFKLFDLAAFFGSGKYTIPEDKVDLAAQSFLPIIDSLILFSNKYSKVPRTATLVILGFADGAGFDPASELYATLIAGLGKAEATKQELNQKLSELRARELIKQLTAAFFKKADSFRDYDKMRIEYIGQGKGEKYPLPYIKDYREDDERRRIVLCYWVVLPD
jgi:hypothetical protein